jgi:prophage antirepressor-like protein
MNEIIKIYNSNKIRIIKKSENIFFNAQDICISLGLSNTSRAISTLKKDDITTSNIIDSLGRTQEVYYISESALYKLVFKSKKKEALDFQEWVYEEVLPSIRKTGKYSIPDEVKKISTKNRTALTSEWKEHGIEKPHEYVQLTLQEYKALSFDDEKRKKDFNKGELLLLSALESMETLKLFNNENIEGYKDCKESLHNTAKEIKEITKLKDIKGEIE